MPQLLTGGGGTHSTSLVLPPGVSAASETGGVASSSSSGGSSSSSRASSQGSASGGTAGGKFRAVVSISSDDERDRIFYEDAHTYCNSAAATEALVDFNYYHPQKGAVVAHATAQPSKARGGASGGKDSRAGGSSSPSSTSTGSSSGSSKPQAPAQGKTPTRRNATRTEKTHNKGEAQDTMTTTALGMPDSTRWCADGSLPKVVAHENGAIVNGYVLVNGNDELDMAQIKNPNSTAQVKRYHVSEILSVEAAEQEEKTKGQLRSQVVEDSTFAGSRDVKNPNTRHDLKIVSSKGTIRGVKNRVRAGIATFLEDKPTSKNFRGMEKGKIVIYVTSVRIIRATYERCQKARMILQTHMVCFEEVDIFMSKENQRALMQRLETDEVVVPQVFADGQHLGSVEELDYMNENGELRQIFENFKKVLHTTSCTKCGGYRFVNCPSCHGSKKSLHRNHFTEEFCALRCVNCDDNGLVRCDNCSEEEPEHK